LTPLIGKRHFSSKTKNPSLLGMKRTKEANFKNIGISGADKAPREFQHFKRLGKKLRVLSWHLLLSLIKL
jgi:hypothetical protein